MLLLFAADFLKIWKYFYFFCNQKLSSGHNFVVSSKDNNARPTSKPFYQTQNRNNQGELHDIRFEFSYGKDTAEGISAELVGANLVDGHDMVAIATNLDRLIVKYQAYLQQLQRAAGGIPQPTPPVSAIPDDVKTVTFPLMPSGFRISPASDQQANEKALIGYAQLAIIQ